MRKILLIGLLLPFVVTKAWAGSFSVNPVHLRLSAAEPTAVLNVTNNDKTPTVVQLSLFAWTQKDGKNVYTPTRALLATPPIFNLPSEAAQTVRVGSRVKPDVLLEQAYRLFMVQVPPKPTPGFRGLQVVLRMSLPVFVAPRSGVAKAALVWGIRRQGEGQAQLTVTNKGTAHAQVSDVSVAASDSVASVSKVDVGNGYVLPGASRFWTVEFKASPSRTTVLTVRGKTGQGPFSEVLGQTH